MDEPLSAHDARFRQFLSDLPDGPIWFCFFSSGLLHVVRHFLRFVPPDVNCVLLTSGLTPDEIALRDRMSRLPAFDMADRFGSHELFEFVFRTLDRPFGLIDSDCFVMNGDWFTDSMAGLTSGTALNGAFCYGPIPLVAPPFVAVDPTARPRIERTIGGPVTPAAYAYTPPGPEGEIDGAMVRILEPHHRAALSTVLGMEAEHLPFPQGGVMDVLADGREVRSHERFHHRRCGQDVIRVVFDGMMLYQLVALAAGWRIGRFRQHPGTKVVNAEVVHAGGISYWDRLLRSQPDERPELPLSAYIDTVLLEDFVGHADVPLVYRERQKTRSDLLSRYDIGTVALRQQLRGKLSAAGVAVSDPRWAAVLGP